MIVGLTGPSGSGKSAVAELLKVKGVDVICCDALSREAVEPGTTGLAALTTAFGTGCLHQDGSLDRKKLADLVFSDAAALDKLNQTIHPIILTLLTAKLEERRHQLQAKYREENPLADEDEQAPEGIVVLDAPTLFQAGADSLCARVVSVVAEPELCEERLIARDHLTSQQAKARLAAGLPMNDYRTRSDFVIENNGSYRQLETEAAKLYVRMLGWTLDAD